ncbi:DNA adenine methylase [Alistipes sp.]|uniref:DNA adenine methylase n=1 Tax=Alistipes sp. TaxID=1872444 RepID=UPI003AF04DDC
MKKPLYNSSPLPFMGQKRRFVVEFRKALGQYSDAEVFVDLFGGSGLLSHITKQERPEARVVYNDYDDFHLRLENIPRTNALLANIRNMVGVKPKGQRLPEPLRRQILDRVTQEEATGFVDYITLSASLLFSGNYATSFEELAAEQFYNSVRQTDYAAEGYLAGVEIAKHDYRELFGLFKNVPGVVFLIDPPYLSTEAGAYKCYWKLADYLDVLQCLQGQSYVYFTSTKSQIVELIDWFARTQFDGNPFDGAERKEVSATINKDAKYTDVMIYKRA